MALEGPGEHLASATHILKNLSMPDASQDAQTRATAAVAHAVLALAEQVAMIRHQLRESD